MLTITISPKYLEEKSYVISVLFEEILGLKYELQTREDQTDYEISFNNKKLIIEDHFWNKMPGDLSYLSLTNIPQKIELGKNQFCVENDIPILFGSDKCTIDEAKSITCGIDVFASSFFFISRWEENVVTKRDKFNRFQAKESLAGKENLLHRPIVNEYTEMIWHMLTYLGFTEERKLSFFEFVATHDVDQPLRIINMKMLAKSFLKNIIIFKDFFGSMVDISTYFANKFTPKFDLGYSYEFLMNCSDQAGIKSIFNFQNSKKTKFDWGYNNNTKFMRNIFQLIKDAGHTFGFHPSYNSYNNPDLWRREYEELCEFTDSEIKFGRQHFLRFAVPDTWQIWDNNNLEYDATVGFPEREGFRCGTCSPFSAFNLLERKKLKIKEMPLILMEKTLMNYQKGVSVEEFIRKANLMVSICKKYKGKFVFLWHNSSFDRKKYTRDFYKKLLIHQVKDNN